MRAPERLVAWLQGYEFVDRKGLLPPGLRLQYHSRSDEHSKKLAEFIVDDLLDVCLVLREQAERGEVAFDINHRFRWPNGKVKTLDLAFGTPQTPLSPPEGVRIHRLTRTTPRQSFSRLLIAFEEKAVMTEHIKSQPRIYSELNDAHTIVHQGSRDTIAAGITMANIAKTFVSPLRQRRDKALEITQHRQPEVTASMVEHLRMLPLRESIDDVGLDAYCTLVVDVDNQGHVALHTGTPAPQSCDPDHYETFIKRICRLYEARYSELAHLPQVGGLSIEEALRVLAREHPGLLGKAGDLLGGTGLAGAAQLRAILKTMDREARGLAEERADYRPADQTP